MITRIYVAPKLSDTREAVSIKSFTGLDLSGKVKKVKILDSYLLDHEFSKERLEDAAKKLTNPVLEESYINDIYTVSKNFDWLIEVGFLPGVVDNVGHTATESILDSSEPSIQNSIKAYSSKIFLIGGKIKEADIKKIGLSLYNPLIERVQILSKAKIKKKRNLPLDPPEVKLKSEVSVLSVSLDVEDKELEKIGRDGVMGRNGLRRGPLALDIHSMKAIKAYFNKLGRNPTDIELESIAQTWSEHCKHTIFANPIDDIKDGLYKTYIKGATNEIRHKKGKKDFCVSVFSDNSGGVVFDENYLITHKVETHNSPSALDPFGGAITGIGGVNRDALGFGLGAKPVANTYGFCTGDPEDKRALYRDSSKKDKMLLPKRIFEGVIKGINAGGNTSGIPTLNGFIRFDERYRGKPMVFAGTVGLIPRKVHGRNSHEKKAEPGDYIAVIGGRVGLDGIHGATFSSVQIDQGSPATAVQIGDPITQKKLSDALVKEARDMNLYNSITDNGAGGISSSVAEMAKECGGAIVNLDKVPLKYPGLQPWQIWISESQERMTLSVPKKKWLVFSKLMESRGVEARIIGEFTSEPKCTVYFGDKKIMDLDMEFLHNGLPKHNLKTKSFTRTLKEPYLEEKSSYNEDILNLLRHKNTSGYSFISDQYDHEVQASSVLKPISGAGKINTDAQIFRPLLDSEKGVVLSSSLYSSYGDISPYHMAGAAIDTVIRNTVCAGGSLKHLSILDNFCWSSSNEGTRLFELVEAVKACHKYAVGYGTPFISGKDSMFNDFKGYDQKGDPASISIPPTLLISSLAVMPDILKAVSPEFKNDGDIIYLLGDTNDELGGGEYYKMLGLVGKNVPKADIEKNTSTYIAVEKAIEQGLLSSAISVSSGGLAIALAKASLGGLLGSKVSISEMPGKAKITHTRLFSESQGRVLVSVSPRKAKDFEKIIKKIPHSKLGAVSGDGKFTVLDDSKKIAQASVKSLYNAYHKFSESMK